MSGESIFQSRSVHLRGLSAESLVALAAVPDSGSGLCFAVDLSGQLFSFSLDSAEVAPQKIRLAGLLPTVHPKTDHVFMRHLSPLTLIASPKGEFVARAQTLGNTGGLVRPGESQSVVELKRGDGHEGVCPFPICFAAIDSEVILIYGTAWNRIDACNAKSNEPLTNRPEPDYLKRTSAESHYLNYFHCSLSISPMSRWIISNGWIWHPWGSVEVWNIDAWLGKQGNVWESEDGPTKHSLTNAGYLWNRPLCWLDDETVAIWGRGDDDADMEAAIGIYSVESGTLSKWIEGPKRCDFLATDGTFIFACGPGKGVHVWETASGKWVGAEENMTARCWHSGIGALLCNGESGALDVVTIN